MCLLSAALAPGDEAHGVRLCAAGLRKGTLPLLLWLWAVCSR